MDEAGAERIDQLMETPGLADALGSDRFKQFLDHLPVAIAVSRVEPSETIVYANLEFERLLDVDGAALIAQPWHALPGRSVPADPGRTLGESIPEGSDSLGHFEASDGDGTKRFEAWSNLVEDAAGVVVYRLVALVEVSDGDHEREELARAVQEKDTLLRELQHRVKNNLQMITTLIRVESRKMPTSANGERFDRLAGRVESLALLYQSLSDEGREDTIDLGVYLSQIASAVMKAHAHEGIRLALQVDTWPVCVDVAMPTGLVVNELMTNALKHAFPDGKGGTITVKSLVDESGCEVVVADDGIGLAAGTSWPQTGKMGALIVQSLRQNAKASFEVTSRPGEGTQARMVFSRAIAAGNAPAR